MSVCRNSQSTPHEKKRGREARGEGRKPTGRNVGYGGGINRRGANRLALEV